MLLILQPIHSVHKNTIKGIIMKEKTKDIVTVGGLTVVALGVYYFVAPGAEGTVGGFGGGGIPLLPGDTEGAAEADTIIYNLPMPEVIDPFKPAPEIEPKKATYAPSLIPTYPLEYYAMGGVSELAPGAKPAQKLKSVMELQHYADPLAYAFSGRRDVIPDSKKAEAIEIAETKVDKPVQFKEASVGGFFDFLYPITQLGKGARGRDIALKEKDIRGGVIATKKIEAQRPASLREYGTNGSGREWTGGLTSTTKGAGVHFTKSGSGVMRKRPKKSAPGSPD